MFKTLTLWALALPALAQPATAPRPARALTTAQRPATASFRLLGYTEQQFRRNGAAPAAWLDTLRFTYSRFNAAGLNERTLRENAPTRGAALRGLRQENLRYNAAGHLASDSTFVYNSSGMLNSYATLVEDYTYNAQGKLLTTVQRVRLGGNLQPYGRTSYTYNLQGQNTQIVDEGYFGGTFTADSRDLLTYNAQGQLTSDEFQIADVSGTTFAPSFKDVFTYDAAGNVLTDQQQSYNGGAYGNVYLFTYTYAGPNGQRNGFQGQRYVSGTTLQNYSQGSTTFDADGNVAVETQQRWNLSTQAYDNDVRYLYTYQRILAAAAARPALAPTLAPNPATGRTTLRYTLPAAAPVAVQVLDALGRTVLTLPAAAQAAGDHTLTLPLLLPAGAYTVRFTAGTGQQSLRLLVE